MKVVSDIQLGMKEQNVYIVDDFGNVQKTATVELQNLGETLCGLYMNRQAKEIVIRGPKDLAMDVEMQARKAQYSLYGRDDLNIHIEI